MDKKLFTYLIAVIIFGLSNKLSAQISLSLEQAIDTAVVNYGTIRAKKSYIDAAQNRVEQQKMEYIPNVYLSAQNNYGTINGQNGPLYAFAGQAIASSGLPLAEQSWSAAFGALYLANVNWEFFTFGRVKARVETAQAGVEKYRKDMEQEVFNHKIKVAAAYINLLTAQRLSESYRKNLNRADTLYNVIAARARSGLIAGVDSTQAKSQVSGAKILLTQAIDKEQEQAANLGILLGIKSKDFSLDALFVQKIPEILEELKQNDIEHHPVVEWYKSRISEAEQNRKFLKRSSYPSLILGAAYQVRGSGFQSNYAQDQTAFSTNYFDGINPVRTNYVVALGITWNFAELFRTAPLVKEQNSLIIGLQAEQDRMTQQLNEQLALSDQKIENALSNYREVPIQLEAASLAYNQHKIRYENGLTDLVDVTQAAYVLVRAETDRDIAYANVWQALLLKAAATGDFDSFLEQINNNR